MNEKSVGCFDSRLINFRLVTIEDTDNEYAQFQNTKYVSKFKISNFYIHT